MALSIAAWGGLSGRRWTLMGVDGRKHKQMKANACKTEGFAVKLSSELKKQSSKG